MLQLFSLYKIASTVLSLIKKSKTAATSSAEVVDGKKTYLAAIALILYAVSGVFLGHTSMDAAVTMVLNGLGLASIRHAIQKFLDLFVAKDPDDPDGPGIPVKIVPDPKPKPDGELNVDHLSLAEARPLDPWFLEPFEEIQRRSLEKSRELGAEAAARFDERFLQYAAKNEAAQTSYRLRQRWLDSCGAVAH